MIEKIAILGSTGSIGKNALKVIDALSVPRCQLLEKKQTQNTSDPSTPSTNIGTGTLRAGGRRATSYEIVALSANTNIELLAEQVKKFRPKFVAITDENYIKPFQKLIGKTTCGEQACPERSRRSRTKVEIFAGAGGLAKIAELTDVDTVITAVVGAAGLKAVLAAAKAGKKIAVANKEPLVVAGELLTKTAKENNAAIMPIDSEHSAIFQALQAGKKSEVNKIILTASGGPFRKATKKEIQNVTLKQALNHPTWDMGPKITIDSATMMNKALEIIEAKWLFDIAAEKIEVLVHPESIIHSMVEFVDGSIIAQLGTPDMAMPIQYALTYPNRYESIAEPLKLDEIAQLNFEKPNTEVFRALKLAYEVAKAGGTAAAVFNAANEAAVEEFLAEKIKFVNIVELIEQCLQQHEVKANPTLEELLEADSWARQKVFDSVKLKT